MTLLLHPKSSSPLLRDCLGLVFELSTITLDKRGRYKRSWLDANVCLRLRTDPSTSLIVRVVTAFVPLLRFSITKQTKTKSEEPCHVVHSPLNNMVRWSMMHQSERGLPAWQRYYIGPGWTRLWQTSYRSPSTSLCGLHIFIKVLCCDTCSAIVLRIAQMNIIHVPPSLNAPIETNRVLRQSESSSSRPSPSIHSIFGLD